jgi:hypothetical protein
MPAWTRCSQPWEIRLGDAYSARYEGVSPRSPTPIVEGEILEIDPRREGANAERYGG